MLENFVIIGGRKAKPKLDHAKTISDKNIIAAYVDSDEGEAGEAYKRIEEFGPGNEYLTGIIESAPA